MKHNTLLNESKFALSVHESRTLSFAISDFSLCSPESRTDYFAGLRIDTQPWGAINGYGRAGVLYYHSTIDFEESFFDIKPGGDLEEIEEGTGFYLEGGIALQIAPGAKLDAGITWRNRQDYFEDSIRPFDMKELGATIGIVFTTR